METKIVIDKNEVVEYIKEIYNRKSQEYFVEIDGVKVDAYFPSRKIAIKCRGYQWDEIGYQSPRKDSTFFKKRGIRLVNIYDYEWYNFKDSFKQFINTLLNSRDKKMIRSKEVVEIDNETFLQFLDENHLFKRTIGGCTYRYGIYENDELVAVAGFDNKRKVADYEWKRFAIKHGYMSERNLAQLFLDKFAENHSGKICDYQQIDRFPFSSDEAMGFTKIRSGSGSVAINLETYEFTRHQFIPEKPLNRVETLKKYGFDVEVPTAGTITWIKDL